VRNATRMIVHRRIGSPAMKYALEQAGTPGNCAGGSPRVNFPPRSILIAGLARKWKLNWPGKTRPAIRAGQ